MRAAGLVVGTAGSTASVQTFFHINTGGTAGTYHPIGGLIANAISQPAVPESGCHRRRVQWLRRQCQTPFRGGGAESASQADVAWAYTGNRYV